MVDIYNENITFADTLYISLNSYLIENFKMIQQMFFLI